MKQLEKKEVKRLEARRIRKVFNHVDKEMARQYRIYYAMDPVFLPDPGLKRSNLGETHVWLMDLEAENLEDVFKKMQGEKWSPNGEARQLILSKGFRHTSISVGDVVYDVEADKYFEVDMIGFREIT